MKRSCANKLGGMNGYFQSDLATLAPKNGEQLEYFCGRILRHQQEIMLSGVIVFPTRLLLQYTKEFTKSDKLRAFIAPKMKDLISFLNNNEKYAFYTGGDINVIYQYIDINRAPTTLTTSGQRSHHFIPSSSINNYSSFFSQLLQISAQDRRLFVNAVEKLDTNMMPA